MLGASQLVTMVEKKERQTDDERLPSKCNAPNDVPFVLQGSAAVGGPGNPHQTQPTFPGRQAHEVVFILRRIVEQANEWQIPIFVLDCDVAAAFDHVSHQLIIDAMEALEVPPLLVAAWMREYRGSETYVKLDDLRNSSNTVW